MRFIEIFAKFAHKSELLEQKSGGLFEFCIIQYNYNFPNLSIYFQTKFLHFFANFFEQWLTKHFIGQNMYNVHEDYAPHLLV